MDAGDRRTAGGGRRPEGEAQDEALYWLAHSLNQSGDAAAAIATIRRLEREYPASLWVKPARIAAARDRRSPAAQRRAVVDGGAAASAGAAAALPPRRAPAHAAATAARPRAGAAARRRRAPPPCRRRPRAGATRSPARPAPPAPPTPPPAAWLPECYRPDTDLRIQALGSLMRTDAARVIPMLREIALDSEQPARGAPGGLRAGAVRQARGARRPSSRWRRPAAEPVRIAAVRELGRFGGPDVSRASCCRSTRPANSPVKKQVVTSLGRAARARRAAARSPSRKPIRTCKAHGDRHARAGRRRRAAADALRARQPRREAADHRRAVQRPGGGRADSDRRPGEGSGAAGRGAARLRLLGTPKAKAYLQKDGADQVTSESAYESGTSAAAAGRRSRRFCGSLATAGWPRVRNHASSDMSASCRSVRVAGAPPRARPLRQRRRRARSAAALSALLGVVRAEAGGGRQPRPLDPRRRAQRSRAGRAGPRVLVVPRVDGWYRERARADRVSRLGRRRSRSARCRRPARTSGARCTGTRKDKKFRCPCHGGVYDADGKVLEGPPPRPLDSRRGADRSGRRHRCWCGCDQRAARLARTPAPAIADASASVLLDEPLPPGTGWFFTLGSVLLALLGVQLLTGAFLTLYYAPTPDHAYDSVRFISSTDRRPPGPRAAPLRRQLHRRRGGAAHAARHRRSDRTSRRAS